MSTGIAKRYTTRAWVSMGLTKPALKKAIEAAAWEFFAEKKADAVAVFFYRYGIDTDSESLGNFTVGKVTVAPGGRWKDAGKRGQPTTVTEMRESYFDPIKEALQIGTSAHLVNERGSGTVPLCGDFYVDLETAIQVKHGTPVTILQSHRMAVGTVDLMAYEVRTAEGRQGWVRGADIATELPSKHRTALKAADPREAVKCDRFKITGKLSGDSLLIALDTDLPENIVFILSVGRCYTVVGKTSRYPLDYYSEKITVARLRRGLKVSVSDSAFLQQLQDRKELMRKVGEPIKVSSIEPMIQLNGTVGSGTFGKSNANLIGAAVTELRYGLRILESEQNIEKPLR